MYVHITQGVRCRVEDSSFSCVQVDSFYSMDIRWVEG